MRTHLHARLHWTEVREWHLPGRQLPQEDCEAPHVGGLGVDVLRGAVERLRGHPLRLVHLAPLLEREAAVGHVHARAELLVRDAVDLEHITGLKRMPRAKIDSAFLKTAAFLKFAADFPGGGRGQSVLPLPSFGEDGPDRGYRGGYV